MDRNRLTNVAPPAAQKYPHPLVLHEDTRVDQLFLATRQQQSASHRLFGSGERLYFINDAAHRSAANDPLQ